jgi:hypothetical protein
MPVANYGTFFQYLWRRSPEPDENFRNSQEADRYQRVRRDAERTMIGIACAKVPNDRMRTCNEQEQHQAHPKRQLQPIQLEAATVSLVCLVCSQGILLGKMVPKIGSLEQHASLICPADSAGQAGRI